VTTPGVRPLTDVDLAQPGPGVLSASRLYVDEVLTWLARVSVPGSFLLPIAARRGLLRLIGLQIGRNVFLGPRVMILTSIHEIDSNGQAARAPVFSQVRISDRCWLGARAMIMPGVTIGEGTIIGAGAVVTHDCEPGAVYVGVPARRVR
jgi:carbonic anhydrase/acetyltransferase-like protein (isoleucine patch superfamily)